MREYSTARRMIFDGGHVTYLATSGLAAEENGDAAFRRTLDDYVALRALLIVCERAEHDSVSRRIRGLAPRCGARHCVVRTDDPNSLTELTTLLLPAMASARAS
jgi:hypothetical protein